MNLFRRLRHRLAHLLGWNTGRVVTWWEPRVRWFEEVPEDAVLMVGFACDTCGEVSHAGPSVTNGRFHDLTELRVIQAAQQLSRPLGYEEFAPWTPEEAARWERILRQPVEPAERGE
jgi:hypothetical protein